MALESFWNRFRRRDQLLKVVPLDLDLPRPEPRKVPPVPQPSPPLTQPGPVSTAIQALGIDLVKNLCSSHRDSNIFVSPLSVYLALAMLENGAAGATKDAMRVALRLPAGLDAAKLNQEIKRICEASLGKDGIELNIANAIWVDRQVFLSPEFVSDCHEYFAAAARNLDLSDSESVGIINAWVAEKTRGKINGILSAPPEQPGVIITNALYFKGKFLQPFAPEETRKQAFYSANGNSKDVLMMHQDGMGNCYRKGRNCQAAALSYFSIAKNGLRVPSRLELVLILPNKAVRPEETLNDDLPELFQPPKRETILDLAMPRFTMEFDGSLARPLTDMGMGNAFSCPGADFTRASASPIYIADVYHKTRLEIDEEGTIAAATTGEWFSLQSPLPKPKYKQLVFDHPFAVILRDSSSQCILFAGVVHDP